MDKTLSKLVLGFLEYKKQNGYVYTTGEYHLNKYLDFTSIHAPLESIPGRKTIKAFLNRYSDTPGNLYNAASVLREFSRYLISLGHTTAYVIPAGKFPFRCLSGLIYLRTMRLQNFLRYVTAFHTTAMFQEGISCCLQCTGCFIAAVSAVKRSGCLNANPCIQKRII